jgi:SNF2 family DNA or RNA helicase
LTAAEYVLYFSNDFDAEKRNQSEDRAHRISQTKSVTYVDYTFPGKVTDKIIGALRSKKSLSQLVTASTWRELLEAA